MSNIYSYSPLSSSFGGFGPSDQAVSDIGHKLPKTLPKTEASSSSRTRRMAQGGGPLDPAAVRDSFNAYVTSKISTDNHAIYEGGERKQDLTSLNQYGALLKKPGQKSLTQDDELMKFMAQKLNVPVNAQTKQDIVGTLIRSMLGALNYPKPGSGAAISYDGTVLHGLKGLKLSEAAQQATSLNGGNSLKDDGMLPLIITGMAPELGGQDLSIDYPNMTYGSKEWALLSVGQKYAPSKGLIEADLKSDQLIELGREAVRQGFQINGVRAGDYGLMIIAAAADRLDLSKLSTYTPQQLGKILTQTSNEILQEDLKKIALIATIKTQQSQPPKRADGGDYTLKFMQWSQSGRENILKLFDAMVEALPASIAKEIREGRATLVTPTADAWYNTPSGIHSPSTKYTKLAPPFGVPMMLKVQQDGKDRFLIIRADKNSVLKTELAPVGTDPLVFAQQYAHEFFPQSWRDGKSSHILDAEGSRSDQPFSPSSWTSERPNHSEFVGFDIKGLSFSDRVPYVSSHDRAEQDKVQAGFWTDAEKDTTLGKFFNWLDKIGNAGAYDKRFIGLQDRLYGALYSAFQAQYEQTNGQKAGTAFADGLLNFTDMIIGAIPGGSELQALIRGDLGQFALNLGLDSIFLPLGGALGGGEVSKSPGGMLRMKPGGSVAEFTENLFGSRAEELLRPDITNAFAVQQSVRPLPLSGDIVGTFIGGNNVTATATFRLKPGQKASDPTALYGILDHNTNKLSPENYLKNPNENAFVRAGLKGGAPVLVPFDLNDPRLIPYRADDLAEATIKNRIGYEGDEVDKRIVYSNTARDSGYIKLDDGHYYRWRDFVSTRPSGERIVERRLVTQDQQTGPFLVQDQATGLWSLHWQQADVWLPEPSSSPQLPLLPHQPKSSTVPKEDPWRPWLPDGAQPLPPSGSSTVLKPLWRPYEEQAGTSTVPKRPHPPDEEQALPIQRPRIDGAQPLPPGEEMDLEHMPPELTNGSEGFWRQKTPATRQLAVNLFGDGKIRDVTYGNGGKEINGRFNYEGKEYRFSFSGGYAKVTFQDMHGNVANPPGITGLQFIDFLDKIERETPEPLTMPPELTDGSGNFWRQKTQATRQLAANLFGDGKIRDITYSNGGREINGRFNYRGKEYRFSCSVGKESGVTFQDKDGNVAEPRGIKGLSFARFLDEIEKGTSAPLGGAPLPAGPRSSIMIQNMTDEFSIPDELNPPAARAFWFGAKGMGITARRQIQFLLTELYRNREIYGINFDIGPGGNSRLNAVMRYQGRDYAFSVGVSYRTMFASGNIPPPGFSNNQSFLKVLELLASQTVPGNTVGPNLNIKR